MFKTLANIVESDNFGRLTKESQVYKMLRFSTFDLFPRINVYVLVLCNCGQDRGTSKEFDAVSLAKKSIISWG